MLNLKILFYTKYSRLGASSRYRTYQYLAWLNSQGIETQVQPLLGDDYLHQIYSGNLPARIRIIRNYLTRLLSLQDVAHYDLIVLEKELFPRLPLVTEKRLARTGARIIVDYDDAIFHDYEEHPLLKEKIGRVMRSSSAVTVGNDYLATYAERFNSQVYKIPTCVDLSRYKVKRNYETKGPLVIGWIGTPITARYLYVVEPALKALSSKLSFILRCVGTPQDFSIPRIHMENVPWSEESEVDQIRSFDIGIMPLTDDPYSRGKCGLKLIQYMACGVPVVASPVGVNGEIVQDGVNGYLAGDEQSWLEALAQLGQSEQLREQMGKAGREKVESHYSLDVVAPKLLRVFQNVLASD